MHLSTRKKGSAQKKRNTVHKYHLKKLHHSKRKSSGLQTKRFYLNGYKDPEGGQNSVPAKQQQTTTQQAAVDSQENENSKPVDQLQKPAKTSLHDDSLVMSGLLNDEDILPATYNREKNKKEESEDGDEDNEPPKEIDNFDGSSEQDNLLPKGYQYDNEGKS